MTTRLGTIALIAILALAFGAIASACDGDDGGGELTLQEYFEELDAFSDKFTESGEELQIEFEEREADATDEQASIDVFADFIGGSADVFRSFAEDIDGLEPPAEAQTAHDAAVAAAFAMGGIFRGAQDDLEDAETENAALDIFGALLASGVVDQFDQTCVDLQDVADENSVSIDLDCGE